MPQSLAVLSRQPRMLLVFITAKDQYGHHILVSNLVLRSCIFSHLLSASANLLRKRT